MAFCMMIYKVGHCHTLLEANTAIAIRLRSRILIHDASARNISIVGASTTNPHRCEGM